MRRTPSPLSSPVKGEEEEFSFIDQGEFTSLDFLPLDGGG